MTDPSIYPPVARKLKDPVNSLSAYTVSDKWLLGSIALLVLRPIFSSVQSMVRFHSAVPKDILAIATTSDS